MNQFKDFQIQEATLKHAQGLANVHVKTWKISYKGIIDQAHLDALDLKQREERWINILQTPNRKSQVYVLLNNQNQVIGFYSIGESREKEHNYTHELWGLYILPEYQGRGLGLFMFEDIKKKLHALNAQSLCVMVLEQGPAVAYYKKMGAQIIKARKDEISGKQYTVYLMGWDKIYMNQLKDFHIQEATLKHAPGIASVLVKTWQQAYKGVIDQDHLDSLDLKQREERWQNILQTPNRKSQVYVLLNNKDQVVGVYSVGQSRYPEQKFTHELYLIYILPEYQGRGLGRFMFQNIKQQLHVLNAQNLCVMVLQQGPALGYYQKMGAQIIQENQTEIGGKQYKEYLMGWDKI
jgi:GNAT superfamily N-acetyltransferase